jgi:hypothetical protein
MPSDNRDVMKCYYAAIPSKRGYRKRMHELWLAKYPGSMVTEQRLADQCNVILKRNLLTPVELEELQRATAEAALLAERHNEEERHQEQQPVPIPPEEPVTQQPALNPKQLELKDKLMKQLLVDDRQRLPALKDASSKNLTQAVRDINVVLNTIHTASIGETNHLIYSAAVVVTEELGHKVNKPAKTAKKEPPKWKVRLEQRISNWRTDISCLEHFKAGTLRNIKTKTVLTQRYHLEAKTITEVAEELKQRVLATAKKIERYESRIQQFRQNRQFKTNQRRFYQNLEEGSNNQAEMPDKEETTKFWRDIWDSPEEHSGNAAWIKDVESNMKGHKMEDLTITPEMVKKQTKKVKNWTAPGKDEVHGYWLKHLTSLHARLAQQLNHLLQSGTIEGWMTTGRTTLLMKSKEKGAIPSNYRPITCLPTTFKLMTAIIADSMQDYLEQHGLIPDEQKGNRRQSRGTKDQLLIDKMILRNAKRRKVNLHVAWIDYKKAFDSLPHSWIAKCLDMLGISSNIRQFLKTAMASWNTLLAVNGQILGQVNIRRGIFQGDSLSPLLFVAAMIPLTIILRQTRLGYQTSKSAEKISHLLYMDDLKLYGKSAAELESLLNTVRIFSNDISMEFGLDKCATLTIQRGKVTNTENINMPNNNNIKGLSLEESYKYLGILQADDIKHTQVKAKSTAQYTKRVRKVLKSKLNGGNIIKAINSWAVPVIRYTAGVVDWTQAELEDLDRKTRKLMTANHALHPQSDVDRLYLPRKAGGRGLLQIRQTVEEEKRALNDYIKNSTQSALKEVAKEDLLQVQGSKKEYRAEELRNRQERWQSKALHGQYLKDIEGKVDSDNIWNWLTNGELKKETEGFLLAAQDQALRTNAIKAHIDGTSDDSKCRLCKEKEETIDHLVSACSKIAQTDYKERHNKVASMLHWNLCKKYHLPAADKWWEHKVEKVLQNDDVKILWDFKIQTDKHLAHNIPDITVVEKKQVWLVDVAIPGDSRIQQKEIEKITKYQDLKIEVERLWEKKAMVVPVVIGALGAIPRDLKKHLNTLGLDKITPSQLQKAALLGTAHILRKYL